jgi:hypothetical protein
MANVEADWFKANATECYDKYIRQAGHLDSLTDSKIHSAIESMDAAGKHATGAPDWYTGYHEALMQFVRSKNKLTYDITQSFEDHILDQFNGMAFILGEAVMPKFIGLSEADIDANQDHLKWLMIMANKLSSAEKENPEIDEATLFHYITCIEKAKISLSYAEFQHILDSAPSNHMIYPNADYIAWYARTSKKIVDGIPNADIAQSVNRFLLRAGTANTELDNIAYHIIKGHQIHPAFRNNISNFVQACAESMLKINKIETEAGLTG